MPGSRRRIDRDDLAWMLFVTVRLARRREQLKVAAVAGDRTARAVLRSLDAKLCPHVTREVRDLRSITALVVPAADENEDLNASIARETRLADANWYRLSARGEKAIETFFAGWRAADTHRTDVARRAAAGKLAEDFGAMRGRVRLDRVTLRGQ